MKSSHRYVTLLATASLVLACTAQAQSAGATSRSTSSADLGSISRVNKDSVKHRFTANDLIGASVYDPSGDKIGDIADIDLRGAVPGSLAAAFNQDQNADRSSTMATTPARSTGSATRDAGDALADSASKMMGHATVYISVGGLWGIGDDLVSVPMSKLSYNPDKKHFQLASAKADVVALAEGDRSSEYAATPATGMGATAAGKQSFAAEASRVQAALKSDPMTSAFADKLSVTSDGETLEIRGTLENKEQQKRIIEAARRSTRLKVNDETEVRD